jgi:hypothetical protein
MAKTARAGEKRATGRCRTAAVRHRTASSGSDEVEGAVVWRFFWEAARASRVALRATREAEFHIIFSYVSLHRNIHCPLS